MYPVFPHASQPSHRPAHLARAALPYYPAPQAPSAARTPPAVWVLVAMGLMAALGGLFATCGVLAAMALAGPPEQAGGVVSGTASDVVELSSNDGMHAARARPEDAHVTRTR